MTPFMTSVKKFLNAEDGFVDGGLAIALIASVCITAIAGFGLTMKSMHEADEAAKAKESR